MDTGDARIRVTVQSVAPNGSQSPSKRPSSRTTTIPLRTGESSPITRRRRLPTPAAHIDESDISRRSVKKRKGTPVAETRRSARSPRIQPDPEEDFMDVSTTQQHSRAASAGIYSEQSVPSSEIRRRRSLYPMRNQRYKRLSTAREELNDALQDAILEREASSDDLASERGGEMTAANEDFTMITGESLASIKASTTMLSTHDEIERSHVSIEHLTSSPPSVKYPDIAGKVQEAKTPQSGGAHNAMNWKPTGPVLAHREMARAEEAVEDEDEQEDQDEQMVGLDGEDDRDDHQFETEQYDTRADAHHDSLMSNHNSPTPKPTQTIAEEDAVLGARDPSHHSDEAADDDIWAEEASRDIDDSAASHRPSRASKNSTTVSIPPIFAEEPNPRPPRAKLPRTWRQTSGVDLTYSDSPDRPSRTQEEGDVRESGRRGSRDDEESGRSSGVLTPPSTDDDESRHKDTMVVDEESGEGRAVDHEEAEGYVKAPEGDGFDNVELDDEATGDQYEEDQEEGDISGFTNPHAADTQLEVHHRLGQGDHHTHDGTDEDFASSRSEASSSMTTPNESGEDTGFFWRSNMPQVYRREEPRPQERKAIDLSALLRMDSSKVEDSQEKTAQKSSNSMSGRYSNAETKHRSSPIQKPTSKPPKDEGVGRLLNTPMRKSLLRSSKALDDTNVAQKQASRDQIKHDFEVRVEETEPNVTDDSLASKASDQRQLLGEFRLSTPAAKKPATERLAVMRDESPDDVFQKENGEPSYEEETQPTEEWPERSYEENLNLTSPQKVTVNFNDSTLSYQQQPSVLAPRGPVRPLFDKTNAAASQQTHTGKTNASPGSPMLTLVGQRPTAPQQENEGVFSRLTTSFWSAVARQQGPPPTPAPAARTTEQTISISLRAQLRSRYGVLPNTHPWTMAHMRTLHRLLNSVESGRRDSIVPTHSPLPGHLIETIETDRQDATGRPWRCAKRHASIVQAFMQLLVEPALFRSMEKGEVEWLGDAQAAHLRGTMGGRAGSEFCFKTVKRRSGLITWEWVLDCLGCCVISNLETGGVRMVDVKQQIPEPARDVEFSIMGDGEGDGRVREWFERERSEMVQA